MTPDQLHAISQNSCGVLTELGIDCVYIAPDEGTVRELARMGGFTANRVSVVRTVIDPTTSE